MYAFVTTLFTLDSESLSVSICCLADDNRRFDHLGVVSQVVERASGRPYLTEEHPEGGHPDSGVGICEEFTPTFPIGYRVGADDAKLLKIGVGLVELAEAKPGYSARTSRLLRPERYETTGHRDRVRFRCVSHRLGNYGYEYAKEVSLTDRTVGVAFFLRNTGAAALSIQTYSHNFFGMSDGAQLVAGGMGSLSRLSGPPVVHSTGPGRYTVDRPRTGPTLYAVDPDSLQAKQAYRYAVSSGGLVIQEVGDFRPCKFKLWAAVHCICPEVFAEVGLEPGQQATWKREFTFREEKSQ